MTFRMCESHVLGLWWVLTVAMVHRGLTRFHPSLPCHKKRRTREVFFCPTEITVHPFHCLLSASQRAHPSVCLSPFCLLGFVWFFFALWRAKNRNRIVWTKLAFYAHYNSCSHPNTTVSHWRFLVLGFDTADVDVYWCLHVHRSRLARPVVDLPATHLSTGARRRSDTSIVSSRLIHV